MAVESKTQLKTYFNTGDKPTEQQFANLIDSFQDYSTILAAISALSGDGFIKKTGSSVSVESSGGAGSRITDSGVIALLIDSANWNDSYGNAGATVGGSWNTTVPTGSVNDYYVEPPATDGTVKHIITFKYDHTNTLKPFRTPYLM